MPSLTKKRAGTSSKRSRSKDTAQQPAKQTKKQIAYSRKEAQQNRIILLSVAGIGLLILLVLAIGLVLELAAKPAAPVANVNGIKIRTDHFQELLKYRRYSAHLNILNVQNELGNLDPDDVQSQFLVSIYEQQLQQLGAELSLAPENALDELIEDALVLEKAEQSGIAVTDDEVHESIQEDLRLAAAPPPQAAITDTQSVDATPIPQEQIDEMYQNALNNMGLSDRQFRAIVKRSLYRTKLQDLLASQVLSTGLVAHVQLIQTDTEDDALAALNRVESGEEFSIVASEVSTDTISAQDGGDLGWVTTGQVAPRYGEAVESAAFELQIGNPELVQSDGRYYVVLVLDRDENGPLPEALLSRRQNLAFSDWLAERLAAEDVEIERLLQPEQIPPDPLQSSSGG